MISILKDILVLIGIPGKIIASIIIIIGLIVGGILVDRAVNKRETALKTTVQYIPQSQKADSILLVKIDDIAADIKEVKKTQKATNVVNSAKFKLIINDNKILKQCFESLDNSIQNISPLGIDQKKNSTLYLVENIK